MADYAVHVSHAGELAFQVSNGRAEVATEWNPVEGKFLATELFLASLGACMLATLVDYGQRHGIDVEGATVKVSAGSATNPVRMTDIEVEYDLPASLTQEEVDRLVRAGNTCKVEKTIQQHEAIQVSATVRSSLG